jgi:glucose dehydrogenase
VTPYSLFRTSGIVLTLLILSTCGERSSLGIADIDNGQGAEWPHYRGDLSGTGFSSLTRINAQNVNRLQLAWRYSLRDDAATDSRNPNSQATPIVVDGKMFLPTVNSIVALNPVSGDTLWEHQVDVGRPSRRGVSYWPGTNDEAPRLFFTTGMQLHALNADTGEVVSGFGDSGKVELITPYLSVPLVHKDIIVVGANTPPGAEGGIGNPRAYSAIDGEKLWEFSSVPQPGVAGNETWAGDSWQDRLGANAWPFYFTVDTDRDLLYLPLASPIPFAYGGDRPGDNLYANSIVAVDLDTGNYVWHFQTIHHDIWDHDPPAPPTLFDIAEDGNNTPALAVTTKSGYLFILNRETGEPLVDVQERAVPQSTVPGELTSPTQPIPAVTPPMARVSFSMEEIATAATTSAAHAAACQQLLAESGEVINRGAYTPWNYRDGSTDSPTTLLFPGLGGGPNWGGVAYDPNSQYLFVFAADIGTFGWLEDTDAETEFPYVRRSPRPGSFAVSIDGMTLPCQAPPWSHLTAVDSRTGEIAWRVPLGVSEVLPAANQNTGRPGRASGLITDTDLLFIAATDDNRIRALRASNGEQLWESVLPNQGNANPMTYLGADRNQYLAITATDELLVYALPD